MGVPQLIANRYERLEKLGQGGMGAVHKVKDRLTGDTVALKQVSISPRDLVFVSRAETKLDGLYITLTREFQTLAGLRHPNIISVLDYGYDHQRQPFYTMEYIKDRTNIRQVAKLMNVKDKVSLLIQLLQGLAYLHRRQVIHRDLKPGNIMVVDNQVKVLDFGLAMIQQEIASSRDSKIAGTIAYMAPELFHKKDASVASDLYAVGVIAYQIFSGSHPFDIQNPGRLMSDVLTKNPDVWNIGLSEDLAVIVGRLLAKTPEERYDSATKVVQALYTTVGETAPPESSEVRQSYLQAAQFVGRENELHQLEQALEQAIAGEGTVWLVGGESGVGKSRLLDELRIRALVRGAIVLRGQSVDGGGVPFQLWRNIVRHLILSTVLNTLEKSILKEIIPDIATLLGEDIPGAPMLDGKEGQRRLILTIVDVIKRQKQPLVLLLEDLQWSVESLEIINYLKPFVSQLPVLIIGNYRNDEAPKLPQQLPGIPVMPLSRLDEEEIAELSASMLGDAGKQPQVLDILKQETEGNCFFMVEVVQVLADEAGRLADIGRKTLPDYIFVGGISQVVRRRLERIPIWGQDLLKLVALAGRQLDLPIIQRIITQHPQLLHKNHSLQDWLATCTDCAVLDMQDQQWRFSHDKLRESVLQDISEDTNSQLHRTIAEAIETIYPENDDYNEILLNHWHKAGNPDKEIHYLQLVAEHLISLTRTDYKRASQLLERGLQLLPPHDPRRIKLLNWRSQSTSKQGNNDLAYTLAKQAWELAKEMNDEQGIADSLTNLGGVAENQSDYDHARAYYQQGLEIYQKLNDQSRIANNLNNLGVVTNLQQDRYHALDYFQQSLSIYEQLDDLRNVARLLNNLANISGEEGDYETALAYHHRSLAMIQQLGDHLGLAINYNNMGIIAIEQGHYTQAEEYNQQGLVIFQQINHRNGIATSLANLAKAAYEHHDYAQAQDYQQQSLSIRQQIGHKDGVATSLNTLGEIAYVQSDYTQAQDYFQQSLAISQSTGNQYGIVNSFNSLGLVACQHHNYKKAQDYYQQGLAIAQTIDDPQSIANTLKNMGFAYLKQRDEQAQGTLVDALTIAQTSQTASLSLEILVGFAWLYLQQGDPSRATQLLGLVQAHPLQANSIQLRLDECLPQLDEVFDSIELRLALQRGSRLDLDTVVQELFDEFARNK